MFDLKTPCMNCPFRKGKGEAFCLNEGRLEEIFAAASFQCHKTVDYSEDTPAPGDRPQQCAGLMAVLHREGKPNQMMQVASRLGAFNPFDLDPRNEAYGSFEEVNIAHSMYRRR